MWSVSEAVLSVLVDGHVDISTTSVRLGLVISTGLKSSIDSAPDRAANFNQRGAA